MSELEGKADIVLELTNFLALLWEDVDRNEGRTAAEFYSEDGIFDSKVVCFKGRQEIRSWFEWRRNEGRNARHLLSNFTFDFSDWHSKEQVNVRAIMTHYGADGKGVQPASPPIGIYDQSVCVRKGGVLGWSILQLVNDPIFMADDHAAKRFPAAKIEP